MTRAQDIFASGQFNELEILRVAREYQADAVLFANVTQYHPYTPPRIGLSLILLSPTEGIAIASASGVWDAREKSTSMLAHSYFKQTQEYPRSLFGTDRVTLSPDVFRRFVCQQVAMALHPSVACNVPQSGITTQSSASPDVHSPVMNMPVGNQQINSATTPEQMMMPPQMPPSEEMAPNGNILPPN